MSADGRTAYCEKRKTDLRRSVHVQRGWTLCGGLSGCGTSSTTLPPASVVWHQRAPRWSVLLGRLSPGGPGHGEESLGERRPSEPVGLPHAVSEGPDSRLSRAKSAWQSLMHALTSTHPRYITDTQTYGYGSRRKPSHTWTRSNIYKFLLIVHSSHPNASILG